MKIHYGAMLSGGIIAITILGAVYLHSIKDNVQHSPPVIPIPVCELAKDDRPEIASIWIIVHSTRISDTTAKYIAAEAFKYPHPILILSLIEVESEFTPTAVSKMGAVGLGQIMYDIHKKDMITLGIHKKRDLFDVDKNIKATSFILQMMLKKSNNDIEKALHFYLGGKDGKYVNRIFSNYVHLSLEIEKK